MTTKNPSFNTIKTENEDMLLKNFIKMRKTLEKEEYIKNIDIGSGFKSIDESDDEIPSAEKYSPIRPD